MKSKQNKSFSGFLNIRKSPGFTAHDLVAKVRRIVGMSHVGHGGTLDPMAEGVLPIALGKACRLLRFLDDEKVYLATVLIGVGTNTDDVEGEILEASVQVENQERMQKGPAGFVEIEKAVKGFLGEIEQVVPAFSAVHINGQRLYKLAREGNLPENLPSRKVVVHEIRILDYQENISNADLAVASGGFASPQFVLPEGCSLLKLRIGCSAGTYIRSIARDLGHKLGASACLAGLLRERAGRLQLDSALSLDELQAAREKGELQGLLQSPETLLKLPALELDAELCRKISFGQRICIDEDAIENLNSIEHVMVLFEGRLLAVCKILKNSQQAECLYELQTEAMIWEGSAF